jgi:lipopolysaccharide/colanic/teichoic acid biosynthesis glycosyltransferase
MYDDAEARKKELLEKNEMKGLMFKMEHDPRVTKVGEFIRKTSIDELPQFFNVLKGDMSLVGTRPPTEDEFLQYEGRHKRRLSLKPGITGLWQVSGRSDISNFEDVVRLDLEYIDNWSLLLDIKLLLKTFVVVFGRVGAK